MKTLQEYLIEQYEYNDNISEGKILDAIKGWFADLFKPSKDIEFDRYDFENKKADFTGETLEKYKKYINDNFDKKNCEVKLVDKKSLKTIICPGGYKPDETNKIGFYKFTNILEKKNEEIYYAIIYNDKKKIKDTPCLISVIKKNDTLEIKNLQVISEFINVLTIQLVFEILISSEVFIKDIKQIICKENTDKNLYNQLINDCKFEKELQNNENIAIKKINNENN